MKDYPELNMFLDTKEHPRGCDSQDIGLPWYMVSPFSTGFDPDASEEAGVCVQLRDAYLHVPEKKRNTLQLWA